MKIIIIVISLLLINSLYCEENVFKTTKRGYAICLTATDFKKLVFAIRSKDRRVVTQLVVDGKCFPLQDGIQVQVVKENRFLGTIIFAFGGRKFHTDIGALE